MMIDIIKKINRQQILEVATCIFAFGISLERHFSRPCFIAWMVICFLCTVKDWPTNVRLSFREKRFIPCFLLIAFFSLGLLSFTYAQDPSAVTYRMFGSKLPWLLFPLFMILSRPKVSFSNVLKSYVCGVLFFILISLAVVIWQVYFNLNLRAFLPNLWQGVTLIFYALMNRAYSNAHIVLALLSIFFLWYKGDIKMQHRYFYLFAAFLMIGFMFINTSRTVLLALVVVLIVGVCIFYHNNWKKLIISFSIPILLGATVMLTENRLSESVKSVYADLKKGTNTFNDPRTYIWKAAYQLNHHQFFTGYGENNSIPLYVQKYQEMAFYTGASEEMGSHNQYIEVYLELGGIGVLFLLAVLVSAPVCTVFERRKFMILVSVLFAMVFMTECFATRSAGAISFAFFLSVIPAIEDDKSTISIPEKFETCVKNACIVVSSLLVVVFLAVMVHRSGAVCLVDGRMQHLYLAEDKVKNTPVLKLDASSCNEAVVGNAYAYHMFMIMHEHVKSVDLYVDCYVSPDCNADWVSFHSETETTMLVCRSLYDMTHKGEWQRLHLLLPPGDNYVYAYICKTNAFNFNNLAGFVLFRNPVWKVVD